MAQKMAQRGISKYKPLKNKIEIKLIQLQNRFGTHFAM